jgi:hypothetical protein
MDQDPDFWHENTGYPALHYSISALFYFMLASLRLPRPVQRYSSVFALLVAIIGFYFWETLELALGMIFGVLKENKTDSLIGDPLIDALGVFAFFFLDVAMQWNLPPSVPTGFLLLQFVLVGAFSFIANDFYVAGGALRLGLLILWFVYVTSLVAAYWPFVDRRGRARVAVLVGVVTIQAFVGSIVALDEFASAYIRALSIGVLVAYLAAVTLWVRAAVTYTVGP